MIAVIGAGPAGLMAAEILACAGRSVTVFDQMPSMGRKFLMAGRGGLNLTHGEALDRFLTRYGPEAAPQLIRAIQDFPPEALRAWGGRAGPAALRGNKRAGLPARHEGEPAAPRLGGASRRHGRAIRPPPPLAGV